jgi:acyl transferase domain-containing protein/acyl carrier protein/NAD(P)-dependent dehydrogenase (short-subunit alcohol dehydrogenase family)
MLQETDSLIEVLKEKLNVIFNNTHTGTQPNNIALLGFSDGRYLEEIYHSILSSTKRAQLLNGHPVRVFEIRCSEIDNPSSLYRSYEFDGRELRRLDRSFMDGLESEETLFIDVIQFDRRRQCYLEFTDQRESIESNKETKNGHDLDPLWERRFRLWKTYATKHGVLQLYPWFSLASDLSHYSAKRHKVLDLAASKGLFSGDQASVLKVSGVQWVSNHFEIRDYTIREARVDDCESFYHLEALCWPQALQTENEEIFNRIASNPGWNYALELNQQVVGIIYSQRIDDLNSIRGLNSDNINSIKNQNGSTVQLLAVNIHPDYQYRGLGDQLLEFMLIRSSVTEGVESICAVTLCKNYSTDDVATFEQYVSSTNELGFTCDPILRFHESHGARIIGPVPGYRLRDVKNETNGVLVCYEIDNRVRRDIHFLNQSSESSSATQRAKTEDHYIDGTAASVSETIERIIRRCMSSDGERHFSFTRPILELGLNSVDILQLSENISFQFQLALDAIFFFEHNTAQKIISYVEAAVSKREAATKNVFDRQEYADSYSFNGLNKSALNHQPKANGESCRQFDFREEDIAIIGVACYLPGNIRNMQDFWHVLVRGDNCISEQTVERWHWPEGIDPYSEHCGIGLGGYLDNIAGFDAALFGVTPKEAELMDPQQRILLELSWACIEDAGYSKSSLAGTKTGVFVGASGSDYARLIDSHLDQVEAHFGIGTSPAILANRLSYFYDVCGPSLQIDTACSASSVALHSAVRSLRTGESVQALVGGVNVICHPFNSLVYYHSGMLSVDGQCKTFDKSANGYVRGEGAALVLLKPLHQAEIDRDHIYAVIKGSAVNHGGQAGGLTAPNPQKQAELIIDAYQDACVEPETVSYVEAHGTGTALGDPIEVSGLTRAFAQLSKHRAEPTRQYCGLGSVKTNLGHLEAASGIVGILKVVSSMKNKTLPATLNYSELNPKISLPNTPYYIVDQTLPWDLLAGQERRRASVSNFGSGGSNAHVVLEEYSAQYDQVIQIPPPYLIALSANDATSLFEKQQCMRQWLDDGGHTSDLSTISATLLVGREHFPNRVAFLVDNTTELKRILDELSAAHHAGVYCSPEPSKARYNVDSARQETAKEVIAKLSVSRRSKNYDKRYYRDAIDVLARLYVDGYNLNWMPIFSDSAFPRVKLPSYPFNRKDYWLSLSDDSKNSTIHKNSTIRKNSSADDRLKKTVYLHKQWKPSQIKPAHAPAVDIVIISTEETTELAQAVLKRTKASTILNLDTPDSADDRSGSHLAWLENCRGCIDLVGCGQKNHQSLEGILWLRSLIEARSSGGLTLIAVTKGLESFDNLSINLAGATRAGLYRMLQSEYSHLTSLHLDLDSRDDVNTLASQIVTEFSTENDTGEICYRKGSRYLPFIAEIKQGLGRNIGPASQGSINFSPEHVLVVTGGTRGLGYLCAQHFVTNYGVKNLVLIGKDSVAPRQEWSTDGSEKVKAIRRLESSGANVHVFSLKLSDSKAVSLCVCNIVNDIGPIGGFIHCAGIVGGDNPAFVSKNKAEISKVHEPKVEGLHNLLSVLYEQPLQYVVLFSSIAALVPSLATGQSDYATANSYMDYVAEAFIDRYPIVSIQWPSWKETGMGAINSQAYRNTGINYLTDRQGLAQLDFIIQNKLGPVVMPAVVNSTGWSATHLLHRSIPHFSEPKIDSSEDAGRSAALIKQHEISDDAVVTQQWLIEQISKELKIDPTALTADVEFSDFGIDSIFFIQICKRLSKSLNISMDPSLLFEHTSVGKLAEYLLGAVAPTTTHAEIVGQQSEEGDIAVVGMSCRFPGSNNLDEFWTQLCDGSSKIQVVPSDRWHNPNGFYAGLIDHYAEFDPHFFHIPLDDARAMDPQALLLLEESLGLFCHAGYSKEDVKGKSMGVYLGARSQHRPSEADLLRTQNPIVAMGPNYLAANISQYFDLCGPSLVVDSACSSALTAMSLAIQALQSGEISSAVTGGVSLLNSDIYHRLFLQRKLLAKNDEFHIFDQRASGAVLGEGIGLVMLKTLEKARADKDTIYGVVKGIAVNNDGRTVGPATPNIAAQKSVMAAALAKSGKQASDIRYIEVNGSGSEVADLLELKAIETVYRARYDKYQNGEKQNSCSRKPCWLGSIKPSIGHPLCAEGIAGFIKLVLMQMHRQWVPFQSAQEPMEHFDISASSFEFLRTVTPWSSEEDQSAPTMALNCFADGGTNAHILIDGVDERCNQFAQRKPLRLPTLNRICVLASIGQEIEQRSTTVRDRIDMAEPQKINPWRRLLTSDSPVIKNHVVFGDKLLPGMAYIDLIHQYLKEKGLRFQQTELKNLVIYHPLVIKDDFDIELQVNSNEISSGDWSLEIEGQKVNKHGEVLGKTVYAKAQLQRLKESVDALFWPEESIDFDRVISRADEKVPLDTIYDKCRRHSLLHTGWMKALGEVYCIDADKFVQLSLGNEAAQDRAQFMFHPSMIDASVIAAGGVFPVSEKADTGELYLPISFSSFRSIELIQNNLIIRVASSSVREFNDLVQMDIEFFSESGKKIAVIERYTAKRVRHSDLLKSEHPVASIELPGSNQHEGSTTLAEHSTKTSPDIERLLKSILSSKLERPISEIDSDCGYYEMGINSAMLLEIVAAIEEAFSTSLAPTLLFEYTNVAELAVYLKDNCDNESLVSGRGATTGVVDADVVKDNVVKDNTLERTKVVLNHSRDIAVIGAAGRYPGSKTLGEFWTNLVDEKNAVTHVPASRWDGSKLEGYKSATGKSMSQWGGFISDVDCFDPLFFKVPPREASILDPQERLFLETCWETLEDAGYTPENLVIPVGRNSRRRVGVYVGVMHKDYTLLQAEAVSGGETFPLSLNYSPIANRISYTLNFHGPSMAVDTVCSSSLTAVHLAIQSLCSNECDLAFAGGVNLSLHPYKYLSYGMMGMHSTDGLCRSFAEGGDGYVSSEGVGCVLLKPLQPSIDAKDNIYAVIKSSSINHVGKVSGLSVPSPVAQGDMIEECLEKAGVDPRSISYVEAHGTGTSLGDPIEIQGLVRAFRSNTPDIGFCAIGSVKSNIGHAEAAAGISGLHKLLLQFKHKILVPSIHADVVNPLLNLEKSPFYVQKKVEKWYRAAVTLDGQKIAYPRRAGLSSFGAFGSNAHLVLEEYSPSVDEAGNAKCSILVPLSAASKAQLSTLVENLIEHIRNFRGGRLARSHQYLSELAYTLQVGRRDMEERLVLLVDNIDQLLEHLKVYLCNAELPPNCWQGTKNNSEKFFDRFTGDDDAQLMIKHWIEKNKYDNIANLWIRGGSLDWDLLYPKSHPRRVSLPTYPFKKERYWIPQSENKNVERRARVSNSPESDTLHYTFVWNASKISGAPRAKQARTLFVAASEKNIKTIERLELAEKILPLSRIDSLDDYGTVDRKIKTICRQLSQYCQGLVKSKDLSAKHIVVYVPYRGSDFPYRCLMGALRTISIEFQFLKLKLVMDSALESFSVDLIARNLASEFSMEDDFTEVLYDINNTRQVLSVKEITKNHEAAKKSLLKNQGVYLIVGGMGGLGHIFSEALGHNSAVTLILVGRSAPDDEIEKRLSNLCNKGIVAHYYSCDTSDAVETKNVISNILNKHNQINGVIHSAGVNSDNLIPNKSGDEIDKVLTAKITSVLNLDEAVKDINLDFFVVFSSMAALGNAGQIDYATGNAFLDVFSAYRDQLVQRGLRKGKTLSINWPLWKDGGMTMSQNQEALLSREYGIIPMANKVGIETFSRALLSSETQVGVFQGDREKISRFLGIANSNMGETTRQQTHNRSSADQYKNVGLEAGSSEGVEARDVQDQVLQGLSKVIGVDKGEIDAELGLDQYGIDSIGFSELSLFLNDRFALNFTAGIFFEINTARKIIEYLVGEVVNTNKLDLELPDAPNNLAPEINTIGENVNGERTDENLPLSMNDENKYERQVGEGRNSESQSNTGNKLAIIGYDCLLPGAENAEEFWRNIVGGVISTKEISRGKWQHRGVHLTDNEYQCMSSGALLDNVAQFDAQFWGVSADDAKEMDPQLRLLLRSIWHCCEHAGYPIKQIQGRNVGVFVAADSVDYKSIVLDSGYSAQSTIGLDLGMLASQISYHYDFTGPSEIIDSACASFYVAIEKAEQAIALGRCDIALVAGAKILLDSSGYLSREGASLLSESKQMFSFDTRSDGYIRGEGVGCVLLKSLPAAQNDSDSIHGVIAGVAVSHSGNKPVSFLSPDVDGQCRAMSGCYKTLGIPLESVNYIEAHGTAVDFGDAAEVAAYKKFFKTQLGSTGYQTHKCYLSTVKTNIGHLEAASGLASLTKVLLALKYKKIPAVATFKATNPAIIFERSPFEMVGEPIEWQTNYETKGTLKYPRRAGLHSFSVGGVNAHLVLEEYIDPAAKVRINQAADDTGFSLIVFSAKTRASLDRYRRDWLSYLAGFRHNDGVAAHTLSNLAFSSQHARDSMTFRAAYVVKDVESLIRCLKYDFENFEELNLDCAFAISNTAENPGKSLGEKVAAANARSFEQLQNIANAWIAGGVVDWQDVTKRSEHILLDIPRYPFAGNQYWCVGEFGSGCGDSHADQHCVFLDSGEFLFKELY